MEKENPALKGLVCRPLAPGHSKNEHTEKCLDHYVKEKVLIFNLKGLPERQEPVRTLSGNRIAGRYYFCHLILPCSC